MFEWMNRHKKDIMKYTLWLVIPSFVLLYGYGQWSAPDIVPWVAKVNEQKITEPELRLAVQNLRAQYRQNQANQPEPSTQELERQALNTLIVSTLLRQKADELGIATTDREVAQSIQQIPQFQDDTQTFNYRLYQALLSRAGYSDIEFEEEQRESITRSKVQSVLASAFFRTQADKERLELKRQERVKVEYLAFEPADYTDQVEVDEEGLKKFFEDNRESYRIPEQRRIAYASFSPGQYLPDVTVNEQDMQRYFDNNIEQYELAEQRRLEFIAYPPQNFTTQLNISEEELRARYEQNPEQYTHPPQVKVRYVQIPVEQLAQQQEVSEEEIKAYYDENQSEFEHGEQAKVRHILLRVPPDASEEEVEAVRQRTLEIRQEIEEGLSFEEAARQYSEDPGSKERGGLYDFFGRGRMVPPFEEAAFNLPLGQVSEPVKTNFGFHLIKVEDRREAGTVPLEQARDDIRKQLQNRQAIQQAREMAREFNSLDELEGDYEIQTTEWFARNEQVPGIPPSDLRYFVTTAFSRSQEGMKFAGNAQSQNVYLLETIERRDRQPKTFEESIEAIRQEIQSERGRELAAQVAQADMQEIRSASVELQAIAEKRGLTVQVTQPFTQSDFSIPSLGPGSQTLIRQAFALEQGEVRGPLQIGGTPYIIRLAAIEPPRLPEFNEVRQQVEQDYLRNQAEVMARSEANQFSMEVFRQQASLSVVAASQGIQWATTPLFGRNDPIPGLGSVSRINQTAFQLEEGQVSDAIEQRAQRQFNQPRSQQPPIQAYHVIQVLDIKESYLPTLDEVREDVEYDFRVKRAEPLVMQHAEETLEKIKSYIASHEPLSATQTVDLSLFEYQPDAEENLGSKGASYNGPYDITGSGQVPGISSQGAAIPFTKTAFSLNPGQISGVVTNYQTETTEDGERVKGAMTGAYILQVLEKPEKEEPPEAGPQSQFAQIENYMARLAQQQALSSWIQEASATSKIDYNHDWLNPDDGVSGEQTVAESGSRAPLR